ncbi:hypothetical protein MMC07_002439 [Pseudocyphellaria aurata]|nr:hypothetical protein [Pseudocyphellaria aurata]
MAKEKVIEMIALMRWHIPDHADIQNPQDSLPHPLATAPPKKQILCRYFATKNGCRAGHACAFVHDQSRLHWAIDTPQPKDRRQHKPLVHGPSASPQPSRQYVAPLVEDDRVVQKPISSAQADDPREFQMRQVRRRFSPIENAEDGGTSLAFHMAPSDPDFPFEMAGLECVLHVPDTYPSSGTPSLDVRNKEMGRCYQINVERGFRRLAEMSPQATLLSLMNSLDKQLESLLTAPKAETVTIVPNVTADRGKGKHGATLSAPSTVSDIVASPVGEVRKPPTIYTSEQRTAAEARRSAEIHQLKARLGRLPLFLESPDGIAYTIPLQPRNPGDLPAQLQSVKAVKLFVSLLYPLQHCRVELLGVAREAASHTENAFERRAQENPARTLIGNVNYLAQQMHTLATELQDESTTEKDDFPAITELEIKEPQVSSQGPANSFEQDDRDHIKIIPRPPEWARDDEEDDHSDDSDDFDSADEFIDEVEEDSALGKTTESSSTAPERGISLSFPSLELYGIEILELVALCITIKCERCKDVMDVSSLRSNNVQAHASGARSETCKKCASPLSIGYRRGLMHANSFRAGHLDLDGCTVVDLLPSNFIPTCSECSTVYPAPGIVSVRGESSMAFCRECHRKMSFKVPEVKFLQVSAAAGMFHSFSNTFNVLQNLWFRAMMEKSAGHSG